jgi:peptidylprolyl isomerase
MRKPITLTCALIASALAVAGCGSSTAPGVTLAPSSGATAAAVTPTTSTSASATTTSSTSANTTPLPAALKTKPKVVPPSGPAPKKLVVKDLIKGTGATATASSTVNVQYVGVLYKGGKQFDASWNDGAGQPISLSLAGGVIQGWTQGIPGMRVGGRRQLIIPPSLAYKNRRIAKIPPNSTLVFVVDLHSVS